MLTKVILEGPLGKQFGRTWELEVTSPNEALRLIDANQPGLFAWIKSNLDKYAQYRVICEYEDGRTEELDQDDYLLERKLTSVRFVPVIEGAGSDAGKFIAGIVLIVAGAVLNVFFPGNPVSPYLFKMGAAMIIGGFIQSLSPQPTNQDQGERKDKSSYYFDGPANTSMQGVPVQLIYGRVLVGSHAISAALSVNQLL